MGLEESIVRQAEALGFCATGFATADQATSYPRFCQWLNQGLAADMVSWLSRHQGLRRDPRQLAPGTKSVLAVAARYPINPHPGPGFAMFARGADYHDTVRRRLKALVKYIRSETPAVVARVCVDSAQLLEREWACRAGIGWIGRQGQIVNPRHGCCLVLGFVLLDIDVTPSEPIAEGCGACRRCVAACPTQAISEDGFVDARRCLSYATIEQEGPISKSVSSAMNGELFGCDACTAVCPKNPRDQSPVWPEWQQGTMPSVGDCIEMTEAEFKTRFKHTAIARSGLHRLKRNAHLALEHSP